MNEQTFKRYALDAKREGTDYAAGYLTGLRRHHHGERFQLPLPEEDLLARGEYGRGFSDGLAGRPPEFVSGPAMTTVHFEVPAEEKEAWVRAAQREDMKLVPWIRRQLNNLTNHWQ